MENYTLPLDDETGKFLSLYLYTDVRNTPEIRKKLMSGEIRCCVVKAAMVVDPLQIAIAANKAALRESRGQLTTKSIFTEILYVMSSSTNISLSLTKFGIHDDDENIVVAFVRERRDGGIEEEEVLKQVEGKRTAMSRLSEFTDAKAVRRIYKIDDEELEVSDLLNSVVSRIATEQSVSLK